MVVYFSTGADAGSIMRMSAYSTDEKSSVRIQMKSCSRDRGQKICKQSLRILTEGRTAHLCIGIQNTKTCVK